MSGEQLPAELVWRSDGHLGDEALDTIADGEESLLPEAARAHLDGCGACSARLGDAALLSLRATELLSAKVPPIAAPAPVPQSQPQTKSAAAASTRAPLPLWPLAAAVAVAALGALPGALATARDLPALASAVQRAIPLLLHGLVVLFRHGGEALGPMILLALVISAATLLAAAVSMVRVLSRKAPVEGGV